ncbi:MAG TPA: alpha amylase C-terminal domain-containing protein, partial [Myxococcaceae bacterium]|nr:alpha amylase C-terminal domain-containing protein [Myxococcaceae bacterium]
DVNVFSFVRWARGGSRHLVCVANLAPVARHDYRVGVPGAGEYVEVLNTDARHFGGGGVGNMGRIVAHESPWDQQPARAEITLPPLGVLWLAPAAA